MYISVLRSSMSYSSFTTSLQEASTHKSAKTSAGNVVVTRDLNRRPFDPKINEFPGIIVERLYVKFGDTSCIGF